MNNVLVTIAPAMDAFTRVYCPAGNAVSAMTSSVRFPSVREQATDRITRLGPHGFGGVTEQRGPAGRWPGTDSTKSSVCALQA